MRFKLFIGLGLLSILPVTNAIFGLNTAFNFFYHLVFPKCEIDVYKIYALSSSLNIRLFGQHIVHNFIKQFKDDYVNSRCIVFCGATGTGKNYAARLIADTFHPTDKQFIKFYSGRMDFPSLHAAWKYKQRLEKELSEAVKSCPQTVFIFDEFDQMPPEVFNFLYPFFTQKDEFKKSLVIFISNTGGNIINNIYLDLKSRGIARKDMKSQDFEQSIVDLLVSKGFNFKNKYSNKEKTVTSILLPFLPLEKSHVMQCILTAFESQFMRYTHENVERIIKNMEFLNEISVSGCKRVADLVNVVAITKNEL